MNVKKFIIISLILCFILSISAVSAVDVDGDINQTLTIDQNTDQISNAENTIHTYSPTQEIEILGAGDDGTFSDLQNVIDDDTTGIITLDKNYTYDSSKDSSLVSSGIKVSDKVIQGSSGKNITIDGKGLSKLFTLSGSVTLKDINFVNGYDTTTSPISSSGTLTIDGSTFINNTGLNGGAIQAGGVLSITKSTFINNTADGNGGAIYLEGSTYSVIDNCTFTKNIAGRNGGAVDWREGSIHGVLINSKFIENIAKRSGGAVYWNGNDGTIKNTTFIRNKATGDIKDDDGTGGDGGAVIWTGHDGIVDNCTFDSNNANRRGGAVYLKGNDNATFSNCKFNHNNAGTNGGAVDWMEGATNGNLINSTFYNNTAKRSGGAVYWSGTNGQILNSNFTNNTATGEVYDSIGGGDGGAILWIGHEGYVDNCRFVDNFAPYRGGAVFLKDSDNGIFNNSYFEHNIAGLNGGAVDWQSGAKDGVIDNCTFINNSAWRSAGAIYWSGTNGTIKNSTFKYNMVVGNVTSDNRGVSQYSTAGGNGGAVVWMGSVGVADNCTFINNTASARGGAVYLQNNMNTTIKNSRFTKNYAGLNGGAVDWYEGSSNGAVINSTFDQNIAKRSGGAIYWNGHNGTIQDSNFTNNKALGQAIGPMPNGTLTTGGDGGAIIWTGALGEIKNSRFVDNAAPYRGGAVYLQGGSEDCDNTTFKDSYFENNHAGLNGGAIDWSKGAHNGTIDNCTFIKNVADRSAGAVYWSGTQGVIANSTFKYNTVIGNVTQDDRGITTYSTAGGNGGAVVWMGSVGLIYNSTFDENTAPQRGGAIYLQNNENTTVEKSNFTKNIAGLNGGAVDWYKGAVNGAIIDSRFDSNLANRSGGAVYWYGHNGTINGSTFVHNEAKGIAEGTTPSGEITTGGDGGAVIWTGALGHVDNCTFVDNNALQRGGAVYLQSGSDESCDNTTFANCNFTDNYAGLNGGAVDWFEGATNGYIINSTFDNNIAESNGGAVFWNGHYGTIQNSNFTNNKAKGTKTDSHGNVGDGGAIIWSGIGGLVENCIFGDNEAPQRGGAVFLQNCTHGDCDNTTFFNCTFESNHAGLNGGAIDWHEGATNGRIINSTFYDNTAQHSGGAVFWNGDTGYIINSIFEYNCVIGPEGSESSYDSDGGAVKWTGSNGLVENTKFINNHAYQGRGGAVYLEDNANGTFFKCYFENNTAGTNGGAVYWYGLNGTMDNVTFINNNATARGYERDDDATRGMGGAIYWYGDNGVMNRVNASSNYAYEDGGVLFINGNNVKMYNSTFTDNTAGDDGGAIFWTGSVGLIYNSTFDNSQGISANGNSKGGAICLTGSNVNVTKSNFTNSYAKRTGGALFITGNYTIISDSIFNDSRVDKTSEGGAICVLGNHTRIIGSSFDNSSANLGGSIYISGNNATIIGSNFTNSYAYEDGGAIYIAGFLTKIYNSTFINGTAADDGGAVYWQGNNGTLDGCVFVNNRGISSYEVGSTTKKHTSKGGTISIIGDNTKISNSNFTDSYTENNKGENFGGTIFITGHDVDLVGCNFNNSEARSSDGGTIYIIGYNVRVINSTIDNSTARKGGSIYIDGVNASVINSTLSNTSAITGNSYTNNNLGGAVYIKGNNANIIGSEIENASAYQGGALYLEGNYCNVTNSSVKGGYAYIDGGALYSTGSHSNVYYSNFTSNEARGDGGAMYWFGGRNSINNTIVGCIFLENVAYANSNSNTKGGGAIYWSEGGYYGTIKDSQFINNSVQSTVKADGGAILWDKCHYAVIDNCIFDGDYVTTTSTGDVWVQGGAIYLRAEDPYTITNSKFINCYSEKEAGALYVQSNTDRHKILIANTTFINNVAQAIGLNSNGGGAVQVKQADIAIFQNVTFINNTANQGGAVTVLLTKSNITFINCTFDNNTATNGNGGSIWANKKFFIYNTTIANSTASNYGGGLYTDTDMDYDNLTFINNTATSGGALYWKKTSINIHNMKFINNTAIDKGGAIYITTSGATIQNVNMTGNKAFTGSAIWADKDVTLIDVYLMKNQANSSSLNIDFDESNGNIVVLFKGKDKYLNAIYLNGGCKLYCTNVTYWDESGETNTGASRITWPTTTAQDTPEGGQNLTIRVNGAEGLLVEKHILTDNEGKVYLNLADVISNTNYYEMYIESELNDDTYYTIIKSTTRSASQVSASANKTTYHSNSTLNVNVTMGATGNVSVYIGDTFIANITLEGSKGSINMSTLVEGVYLPVGNYTLSFVYNGNVKYDKSNTTAVLEISKITPVMLLNVTSIGYNLLINVTVMDGEYNITDATGNVTIKVEDRTATIYLGNGQGMTIIYGLPIGNYTVNATYHGDNNYYNITNSTEANVTEKIHTVLVLDVDSEKLYYINETVPIKVTILPAGEGNITLYINGIPHELTLQTVGNSTFVEFDATELKDGINYVFATYGGAERYAHSWAQDRFNVTKYNSTIGIETANITFNGTEIINITLPDDAEGIIKVLINGTPYLVEVVGGSAQVNVSDLAVGTYNVTVIFNGDNKYYNSTNSTLFNVTKIRPAIEIDVGNVTYGNETVIVVILPDGVAGNVTIKVNDTILAYEEQEIVDGKVTLPGTILAAGNYTVEATYNGNGNYSLSTAKTNFTVYKATPILTVTVEDINYGENANITVTVPDGVTGTIIIKVNGTESESLTITEGKVNLTVSGLASGNYPVEVIYSGNSNYSDDTVTTEFEVFQIGTQLDVEVHDITIWDKEYINITIRNATGSVITNATGNVTINIGGVNHTAEIKDGIARFNTSDLTVGHKFVWIFYDGDINLTGNRSMAEFDVTQRTPIVNVTAQNITVRVTEKITINIPANATGFVILTGNFTKNPIYVDEFTNGVAVISVDDLAVGNYSVHIKYYGNALDNYTTAENDTVFKVDKINATVTINVDDINYTETAVITVTVPAGVEGDITIRLNDTAHTNITKTIVGGKAVFEIPDLAAGNYTVNVVYNGNDDYNVNNTEYGEFEVKKIDPNLQVYPPSVVNGQKATISIIINDRIDGEYVTIIGLDKEYTKEIIDGVVSFTTDSPLDYTSYTMTVTYGGNENFTDATKSVTFTPAKISDYEIKVTGMNITVNDDEIITVKVSDGITNVSIWVDGIKYTNDSFVNGEAKFNITGLKEGVYIVNATVNDENYVAKVATGVFKVSKKYPTINITVINETDIYVGDTVKIIVTVPNDVTENVTIEINGMELTNSTVNGNATFYIPDITYGNKTIVATYSGDEKYLFNSTTANFTVNKRTPGIVVTTDGPIGVGEDITIIVDVPSNATGYVVVNVNGTNYTINITNGDYSVAVPDLGEGTWNVTATYVGDDQYLPNTNKTSFVVNKIESTIVIDVSSINYGEYANITVTVKPDATGYITIRINETRNITLPIADGKVNWIVEGLAADNYTVYANYSGNEKYNKNRTDKPFEVRQISPEIQIIEVISTADDNTTVIVKVDSRVTENVNITIVGIDKNYTAPVGEDGYAVITTDKLDCGAYTVVASYSGDKNFTIGSDNYEFTTNATDDYLINITATDIKVGNNTNITVRVPGDASGNVIIELNGTNYTAVINEGGIVVLNNISTLKEGVYNVTAYFGNDKYVNKTVETRFVVSKVDIPIKVDIEDSNYVGDTVSIKVTLESDATGIVTIEINGETYNPVSFVDGVAKFEVPNVTYGNKTVAVIYSGNDKYVSNFTTANFTVNKRTPGIVVTTDGPIGVGDDITISVDVPSNATGYVVVNVNGTNYTINITNGDYSVAVHDLGKGTWNVTATYVGDDQYLSNTNKTSFVVNKVESTIVIDVDSIDYGNKVNITVTVQPDATGYITIRINETRNITLPIADGKVNWVVEGLAADNYTVYANYSGNEKYNKNRTDKSFEVRQISPEIQIIEVISTADDNATIIVKVDPRVTENVTVTVDGNSYSKTVDENGIAVITTDKLDCGAYTVVASYSGDKNFTIGSDNYEFTTNATDDYLINITATDIKVGNNTNITVRVPGDASGNVIIELNGTNYTAVINEGGIVVLNNISTLKEGVYNVTAYFGNDKYANKSVETRFEVSKVDTPISITVINDTSIYVGDTVKVIVTVPGDVTENVTIEINGKTFSNTTVDGNATFYVPNITYGNKTVVTAYVGDDKYRYNSTTANFTVNKRESYVNVNVTDGKVGGAAVVKVTVPANATGYVIVNVDGQDYAINLTDGAGSAEIRGLANGTYDVTATYLGDDQYLSSINDTQVVKVDKVTTNINIIVSEDGIIANGSDVDITVKVPIDATGKVNITLSNGTSYIVPVIDGEAKLHLETPDIGLYDITAEYLGDDKYTKQQNESSFEVYDNSREVIIIAQDTFVNVNNTVSVILIGAHEGEVTIIISNASGVIVKENATLSTTSAEGIELSTASLTLPLLEAGKYNVSAYYIEHNGTKVILHEGNNNFTVFKLRSEIKIKEIRNITAGENATIELEIELDARANDGNISVIVDGKEYITNTTTLKVTVRDLTAGNYTVKAFYQGNRWYNESDATSSFEVTKNIAPISITVTNSNVGEVEQINITLPENATGYVIVNVDGQEYHANVTNGLAQVNITGLKVGKHNVTAIYVENEEFIGNVTNTTLTVSKLNSTITVKVNNITVGDVAAVNITVITGASGNVTITIGDEYNKTVGVTDGIISVIVPDLTVGEKTVNVTYNGNEKYLPSSNSTNFSVGQTAAEINIVVENITYGEIETVIAFINATGNVTIKLDGHEIDTVDITDGKVVYEIPGLNAGNYTVELIYNGNVNTNSTSVKANFTVAKADPKITIEVEDIIYGDVEHIVVHVNAEGNVTIKVINVGEIIELTLENGRAVLKASRWTVPPYNGQASVDVPNLEVGNYPVEVTYNGNENYNAVTLTADFNVIKANTTVSVQVKSSVKVNETQVLNITINNTNATGNAIIILDGKNYTVIVTNGTANFTTPELGYGNHSVVVIYEGDKNLNGNWTLKTFTVEKLKSELTINVSDIKVGDKQTITVNVTDGATGFVVISVDGKDYYVPIDQCKATLKLENLTNKTYSVHAKYFGDDYYDVSENDAEFNVNKVNSTVSVNVENITVGDKAIITITVPEDATGNVTVVIVNGETYTVPVAKGTGILVVPDLEVGNYTVEVTYNGDSKYLPKDNITTFEVSHLNTTSDDIKVIDQGNGTVVVVVGDNATGNVTINVGNNTYNATVVNGTAVITLDNETPGTHDIEVIYSGDGTHEGANTTAAVNIPKYDSPITISVEDSEVGEKATIVVSVPENATGNITIEVGGQNYTQPIADGNATFEIENLTDGAKTIVAIYNGDNNYNSNFTTAKFTVNKVTPIITVNATDITAGDTTLIEITAPDDLTGPVLIDVNGVGYYVNITGGKGSIEVPITKAGTYNVTARYVGDDKYTNASANNTFNASKVTDTTINVTVENATVGDKAVITVDVPKDATGNVTITVDGKNYTVPVANGTATLVVDDLKAGNYTVNVTYNGDDKYAPANETAKLEISKEPVDIQVIDRGNGTIAVVVGDNATGNVTVKVGNETYTAEVINGTAVITLENNTPGTYDVEAIYSGDDTHEGSTANATATIPKLETPMSITVENIKVGDKETIVVSLPEDAKGNVTIEINGVKYTEEIKNGNATFTIENLTSGNKTVYVNYAGDNNFTGNHTSANFTVEKRTPTVEVDVSPINVGETAEIKVTVPSNATGYVIVEIDNQSYACEIKDGVATVKVKGLASGDVPINVTYLGDDQYDSVNTTSSIKVSKVPSTINVMADNITVGDKAVIKVEVPKDLCGNVTVTIGGKNYTVFVSGGEGTLVIPNLESGDYTVDAIFDGCKKYEPSNATTKFTVSKKSADINVIDKNNGTVTVIVGDNAAGNVTIKVGNETYNATVVNGTATITLENTTPGAHDIEVIYSGDDNHESSTVNSTVTIPKLETPISVDAGDIKVGETATIIVTVPENATGNVTIEIDGVRYTEDIKDGKATFHLDNLTAGTKTIAVEYAGDDTYIGNHTTANITVSKAPSTVKVEIDDSTVGDNVTVKVTAPEDATGHVLIDIDGVGYYVNITNGTGSVEIPRMPNGTYSVNVTYVGDDKYLPSHNNTIFNVNKIESFVIPKAEDITAGENEVIVFTVPEDATGTLTITIDGKEININLDEILGHPEYDDGVFTVAVSNGKGVLIISGLPKGEYDVTVTYNGDEKYLPSTNTTTFKVSKKETDMTVVDEGNGTVVVILPENATGNVTVIVDGTEYTVNVTNGTAVINLDNVTPGEHNIKVIYSGDENHNETTKESTVNIPKYNTPISVEVKDILVGDKEIITVTVPDDATGTVTVEINGKEYTAEVSNGKAVFEISDLAAGDKTVAVKYSGDDSYLENFTTANFTVSKRPSTANATSKDIKVGKDEVITVTVPKDATGRVLIDIDGVGYYATIVNGKAKVIIPELPSGKYKATVTYEGDDKYLPSRTTTSFTVSKVNAPISATGDEIEQGEDATVVVNVPNDATGTVTITVDGKKYTADVKNGKAVFTIPGLTKGDHNITAVYSGDKKYEANSTITDIEVHYDDSVNPQKHHKTQAGDSEEHSYGEFSLSRYETGNPIMVLLLILITIGCTQLRRFK